MPKRGEIIIQNNIRHGDDIVLRNEALTSFKQWQIRKGEPVTVSDASGNFFRARLSSEDNDKATLRVYEDTGFTKNSGREITLLQALPEKERMELIIQKTTELGVDYILPVKTERSISLTERESKQKKSHKWQEVALKAAKQSRRSSIPEVLEYSPLGDAIKNLTGLKLMLKEGTGFKHIKEVLENAREKEIFLLVGPEGGFTDEELDAAKKEGFIPITLGANILRTETAAIAAVGILRYEID